MNTQIEYMRHIAKQRLDAENKIKAGKQIVNERLDASMTTHHTTIPNMNDAYASVRNSGHTPTPEEIHFRRFTSGSAVDTAPKKK